jgi:predicted AlkP superfamily phosphohydrolase/phosphomutase
MSQRKGTRLLAIGLDAAEPTLIRRLIEQDELPALKSLLAEGRWMSVRSPAHIGSGAVWPTFATGQEPLAHGIHGEWFWQPQTMVVTRYCGNNLMPFWKTLSDKGVSVGVLDPPFVRTVGIVDGFEITDWGSHDLLDYRWQAGPPAIADFLFPR